jgi:hypothetical protein
MFVPVGLALLLMWIFRVRRTATIDFDADGILVRGVFIDHRVGWGDIEACEVRRKSGEGVTAYRPTICLVNGKSFWIYGFTSLKYEKAEATVIRLNGELRQHRKRVTKAMPRKPDSAEGPPRLPHRGE